jgi:GNAT superfamily N-acetyltransferase
MVRADLAAVAVLEAAHHNPLPPEGTAVFADRLELFPAGCMVVGEPVAGYAIAHPWAGPPPPLGARIGALPAAPDALFLHDLALAPGLRGQGLVASALARLAALAVAERLPAIRLVAVHGTATLWARHGFAADGAAVASYGAASVPMRLAVG